MYFIVEHLQAILHNMDGRYLFENTNFYRMLRRMRINSSIDSQCPNVRFILPSRPCPVINNSSGILPFSASLRKDNINILFGPCLHFTHIHFFSFFFPEQQAHQGRIIFGTVHIQAECFVQLAWSEFPCHN